MAATVARARGIAVDDALLPHSMAQIWQKRQEPARLGDTAAGGFQANALYGLLEMAESRTPPSLTSDAMVLGLASRQSADGRFTVGTDIRPPLNGIEITATALAIRALTADAPAGRRHEFEQRSARALDSLRRMSPRDTQDQSFLVFGPAWGHARADEIASARGALVTMQRADGGWGQMPTLASDAYASGQALYALHAAGVSADAPTYRRGTDYLLRTQARRRHLVRTHTSLWIPSVLRNRLPARPQPVHLHRRHRVCVDRAVVRDRPFSHSVAETRCARLNGTRAAAGAARPRLPRRHASRH